MNQKIDFRHSFMAGLNASAVAVIFNLIIYFIFKRLDFFTDDIFIQPGQPLTFLPVILSSIIPSLVAVTVFFLFEKYSANGFRNFVILAIVLFIATSVSPFKAIPNVTLPFALGLELMHVVVFGSVLLFIWRTLKAAQA